LRQQRTTNVRFRVSVSASAEVRRATEVLLEHPEIGALIDPELRRFVLNRFPFALIYNVSSDVLRIVVVAHQSRRPNYWRSRLDR
jgi:plasmid stabilization system protein ParE